MVADVGKLFMLALIAILASALAAARVLSPDVVDRVLTVELGYLLGNGVLARRREAPSPVLAPRARVEDFDARG